MRSNKNKQHIARAMSQSKLFNSISKKNAVVERGEQCLKTRLCMIALKLSGERRRRK